jgi:hypothetical protein
MFQMTAYFCGIVTCKSRGLLFVKFWKMHYWVASLVDHIYYVGHIQLEGPIARQ